MRSHLLIATLALSASLGPQAAAQEDTGNDGSSKIQRGLGLLLDGLREEAAPTLRELQDLAERTGPNLRAFLDQMGPAFAELIDRVEDWTRYEAPEMLPNGDIILRRKRPEPEAVPDPMPDPAPDTLPPTPLDPDTTTDL